MKCFCHSTKSAKVVVIFFSRTSVFFGVFPFAPHLCLTHKLALGLSAYRTSKTLFVFAQICFNLSSALTWLWVACKKFCCINIVWLLEKHVPLAYKNSQHTNTQMETKTNSSSSAIFWICECPESPPPPPQLPPLLLFILNVLYDEKSHIFSAHFTVYPTHWAYVCVCRHKLAFIVLRLG